MTYYDLKERLGVLNADQLLQTVRVIGEEKSYEIDYVDILSEDFINPSGDGMEPKSAYADDPEYADEEVVAPKGSVFLMIAE